MNSVFDPNSQQLNIDSKIVVGFERIAEAFKVSLWNENKKNGLSPIQLRILTFLLFHSEELRTISNIANEFNTTKASISDSVKVLEKKLFITRLKSKNDFRVSNINLTEKGKEIALETSKFAEDIEKIISEIPNEKKEILMDILMIIIHNLFKKGIISIQRMCLSCSYYVKAPGAENYTCTLLNIPLKTIDLRVDCNKYIK